MKHKGFTLVELLAVLVLISAIVLISIPSIINYVNENEDNISDATKQLLYSGAQLYVDANPDKFSKQAGNQLCVKLKDIVDANYLTSPILDSISGEEIDLEKSVAITYTYDENLKYLKPEYDILEYCKLCTLVDGSVNEVGSKYTCDLGSGERNFYILEPGTSGKAATLILEGNYDMETLAWCDQNGDHPADNVCAADGLTGKLDSIASAWSKLDRSQIGLPSMEQIMVADGREEDAYLDIPKLSKLWLYDDPSIEGYTEGNGVSGYWTSTPNARLSDHAYFVLYCGGGVNANFVELDSYYGVRPVIYLDLKQI